MVLRLLNGKSDAEPTTAYLMTYKEGKCSANCGFCPQARESKSSTQLLSRVTWPSFATAEVLPALAHMTEQKKIKRVCIQALNYPGVFLELEALVKEIKTRASVPVSVSCQPQNRENIQRLKDAGVDRLGIALDAATKTVFDKVKGGCYSWDNQFRLFSLALSVFGEGNVSTHVIVGLGENEKETVEVIQQAVDLGVLPALFAFTPVRGTALENNSPPKLQSYRRLQVARYLIVNKKAHSKQMSFSDKGELTGFGVPPLVLEGVIEEGTVFRTSGCPDCNRPYYNEKPSGPIYNYPKALNKEEKQKIKNDWV